MTLKLVVGLLLISVFFPLQTSEASALTNGISTPSADATRMKIDQLKESIRERKQETREAIQAKKDELKQRLQTLRDQKKKLIIERMDARLSSINLKTTTRFNSVLDKIQKILNKIIQNAGLAKTKGVDTTALDTATASAQLAINNATAIVASQSAMVYVIQIASESALKESVGSTVSELRLDLKDAHKAVIDAKQAVMNAVKENAKLKKPVPVATGSAQ